VVPDTALRPQQSPQADRAVNGPAVLCIAGRTRRSRPAARCSTAAQRGVGLLNTTSTNDRHGRVTLAATARTRNGLTSKSRGGQRRPDSKTALSNPKSTRGLLVRRS